MQFFLVIIEICPQNKLSLPIIQVGVALHSFCVFFWQMGEKRHACDALHLFDAVDVEVFFSIAICVSANKADAHGVIAIQTGNNLEESFWNNNLVASNDFVLLAEKDGAAHDIDFTIFLSPFPACDFYLVPSAWIQIGILGTAIRI